MCLKVQNDKKTNQYGYVERFNCISDMYCICWMVQLYIKHVLDMLNGSTVYRTCTGYVEWFNCISNMYCICWMVQLYIEHIQDMLKGSTVYQTCTGYVEWFNCISDMYWICWMVQLYIGHVLNMLNGSTVYCISDILVMFKGSELYTVLSVNYYDINFSYQWLLG